MRSSHPLPLLSLLLLLLSTLPVAAHPFLQDSMWVLFAPDRVKVAVNVSLKEILVAQTGAKADDHEFDAAKASEAAEKHRDYLRKHLYLTAGGVELTGQSGKITEPLAFTTPEQTFYQFELEYPLAGPLPPTVVFKHDMLHEFPYAPGQAWDVSYVMRVKSEGSEEVTSYLLRYQQTSEVPTGAAAPAAVVAPVESSGWRTFREYLHHGVMHILTGYDHLLFVAALVLATFSFWEMVKVIAAFTAAHTLTLALSVFDIFRLPPWVVEPVIAASIMFVAIENVFFPRRAHSRIRLAVAFGFGLIHGLGFAGGLLEAMEGLPSIGIWIALAAFSLGVEIGHQIVVLPLFGSLVLGRKLLRDGFQWKAARYGSAVISLCGAYYLFLSVHEQFFAH